MLVFENLFETLSDKEVISITCLNGTLFEGRKEDFEPDDYKGIMKTIVRDVSSFTMEIEEDIFSGLSIVISYVISFEDEKK